MKRLLLEGMLSREGSATGQDEPMKKKAALELLTIGGAEKRAQAFLNRNRKCNWPSKMVWTKGGKGVAIEKHGLRRHDRHEKVVSNALTSPGGRPTGSQTELL